MRLGGAEYIASLDADMIPDRDWLRKDGTSPGLRGSTGPRMPSTGIQKPNSSL